MSVNLIQALQSFQSLQIFSVVFSLPKPFEWETAQIDTAVARAQQIWTNCPLARSNLIFAVLLWEWRNELIGKKTVSSLILSDSLKFPSKRASNILQSIDCANEIQTFSVLSLGRALRKSPEHPEEFVHLLQALGICNYTQAMEMVKDYNLEKIREWSPQYNGKELAQLFKVSGKEIARLLSLQLDWRIDPQGQDCLEYLTSHFPGLPESEKLNLKK